MQIRERVVDELLVLAAQNGQTEAFERLAERWHPRLIRHARRLTADGDGARESVQDAWTAIIGGLHRLNDPRRFGAWALRITTRRCFDWIARRRRARPRTLSLTESASAVQLRTEPESDLALAREMLCRLDPERRALLAMHYIEGLSVAEIARVLEVPPGTVKSRLFNARERLRATLEVRDEEQP